MAELLRDHGAAHEGLAGIYVPEMIQSHPVTTNRIAESRGRAPQYDHVKVTESASYELIRERLRVITAPRDTDVLTLNTAR